jgi:Ca-activated chloride channel family protein
LVADDPVSTFSIDLDSVPYSFMRASLNNNVLLQADAVRVEELINYFPYDCASPQDKPAPFEAHVSVIPSPWNTDTKLVHIGIKGYELPQTERSRSNLVFLIDSSGSNERCKQVPVATQFVQIVALKLAT